MKHGLSRKEEEDMIGCLIVFACAVALIGMLAVAAIRHLWTGAG